MLNLILFGAIAFLLLILLAFLVIVVKDHLKSQSSFEELVKENEKRLMETDSLTYKRMQAAAEAAARKRSEPAEKEVVPVRESAPRTPERSEATETAPIPEKRPQPEPEKPAEPSATLYQMPPKEPEISEAAKKANEILSRDYGHFDHHRLMEEMGLSSEEADEFVVELIHQLEGAMDDIDRAIERGDIAEVEHITHGLKGAALNIGEGGVAQLLTDFNTYTKTGNERPVVEAFQTLLKRTVSDLKIEYSQVA